jgi:hypothetical protein
MSVGMEGFGSQLQKKFLFLPLLEWVMVTPMGVIEFVGGIAMKSMLLYLPWFLLRRETLDPRHRVTEALFTSFSPWVHRLGANFCLGPVKDGMLPRLLTGGAACSLATMMRRAMFGSWLGLR